MRTMLILIFLLLYNFIWAQSNTFDKTFGELGGAIQVVQRKDSSIIVAGVKVELNKLVFKLLNISQNGSLNWNQDYDSILLSTPSLPIANCSNNNILIISDSYTGYNFNLTKIDKSGKIMWKKIYETSGYYNVKRVIQLDNKDILILTAKYGYPNLTALAITKIDSLGNFIWQKEYPASGSTHKNCNLFIVRDGYLINSDNTIIKIDVFGNRLWIKSYSGINALGVDKNDNVIFNRNSKIYKLNNSGELIWEKDFYYGKFICISKTDDNGFIATIDNIKSLEFNSEGQVINESELRFLGDFITQSSEGGFIICGHSTMSTKAWIRKTDRNGEFDALDLVNPSGPGYLNIYDHNYIEWYTNKVEHINIEYSLDNQKTWKPVISNYPTKPQSVFNWLLDYRLFTDSCFIKITDVTNPEYFDINAYPFSISAYKSSSYFAGNEILMWIQNDGDGSHDPRTDGSGFYWPGGNNATISAIFDDGLVWGGKVNGEIRVNGSTYRTGLYPGRIKADGKAENRFNTNSQIFKIVKNWEQLDESEEKLIYEFDYNHWPIELGAPWDDVNEDGIYTRGIDKPKLIGDETLFYVANDLDTAKSRYAYGSDPIGLEFQTTVFGFNREDLKNVVFKKYKVINKSNSNITDMYFTYWADVDLGFANDDYEGFDTTYNMGYMFNGDNNDEGYYGSPPPAVAHMIVQGPIVPASFSDSARFESGNRRGYKNLGMTSAGIMLKITNGWPGDPELGKYSGSLEFYNYMKGLNSNGDSIVNPITGQATIWPLCGDPVLGTGWYEGAGWPAGPQPGDHRYHVPSGPFNLAANDTQEIVIAIPIAKGTDNINSITKLRELAAHVQEFYNTELVEILNTKQTIAPTGYFLSQNYPNPFNPKTTIEYEVPEKSFVTIKIYDILGREVQTLVNNEEQVRFKYKVVFDGSSLASGVYFYRIQANPSTDSGQAFTETKKMVLLK